MTQVECPQCEKSFSVKWFQSTALCYNCQGNVSIDSDQYL